MSYHLSGFCLFMWCVDGFRRNKQKLRTSWTDNDTSTITDLKPILKISSGSSEYFQPVCAAFLKLSIKAVVLLSVLKLCKHGDMSNNIQPLQQTVCPHVLGTFPCFIHSFLPRVDCCVRCRRHAEFNQRFSSGERNESSLGRPRLFSPVTDLLL